MPRRRYSVTGSQWQSKKYYAMHCANISRSLKAYHAAKRERSNPEYTGRLSRWSAAVVGVVLLLVQVGLMIYYRVR